MAAEPRVLPDAPLRGLDKLLRATAGRKSRLHTLRGEFVPKRALIGLPALLLARIDGRALPGPWINREAVRYLDVRMRPDWRVFEFGSGISTAWYAKRAGSVLSVEDSPEWQARTQAALSDLENATVELVSRADYPLRVAQEPDDSYDLIVVDGLEDGLPVSDGRVGCVRAAMSKVRPGGTLMLDNSDRPHYSVVDEILASWTIHRIAGFPGQPLTPTETTFYIRPSESSATAQAATRDARR